jgi:type IX secretion system PorP/SprF family membrane protein
MKKLGIILFGILLTAESKAQQLPLFSQYYFNSFIYNPAHTGLETGTSINLVGRKQYTGLANSIGTAAASAQGRSQDSKSGFGLYVYNDNVTLFRTNAATGSYAYHIPFAEDKTLSFGLGLSVLDHRYNSANFYLVDEGDPVVALLGNDGGISFDANAGVNLDLGNFSMGLANLQMLQNREAFKTSNSGVYYTLANHWMFNAAYKIEVNEHFEVEPYILYRKTKGVPGQADINLFFNWLDKGYAGIAYRDGMSFSTMVGAHLNKAIMVGYAFDVTTNEFRNALGNTHEIALRFKLGDTKTPNSKDDVLAELEKKKYETEIGELKSEIKTLKDQETIKKDTVLMVKEIQDQKQNPTPKTTTTAPSRRTTTPILSTTPKSTPNTSPTTTISGSKHYVIAGSFESIDACNVYIKKLASQGITAYQQLDSKSGRNYVHVGSFDSKDEAIALIQKLKPKNLPLWVKLM